MTLYARYVSDQYQYLDPRIAYYGNDDFPLQATTAYALKKAWPEITLHIVPDAGHSSREPGIMKLLVEVRHSGLHVFFSQPETHQKNNYCRRPQTSSLTSERLN